MLSELIALLKFIFEAVKERRVLQGALQHRGPRGVVLLYMSLDTVSEASRRLLTLGLRALADKNGDVLHAWCCSWPEAEEACLDIEHGVNEALRRLQALRRHLRIYFPELPDEIEIRLTMKMAIIHALLRDAAPESAQATALGDRLRTAIGRMGNQVGDELKIERRDAYSNHTRIELIARSWAPAQVQLYDRHGQEGHFRKAVEVGEENVHALEALRDELRAFIRENIDVEEVFFS